MNSTKRSICVSENGRNIFRYDVNKKASLPEFDMFKAIMFMEKAGIIDSEKLSNMLKVHFGLGIVDSTRVLVSALKNDGKWDLVPEFDEPIELSEYQNIEE
jgi:hypothetical protein